MPACRRSRWRRTRASCCSCWRCPSARAACSRSARSPATARSGSRARCRPAAGWCRSRSTSKHAEVARANLERAGLASVVELRIGRALDVLPQLGGSEPFDLVFIDADKASNADYFEWALALSRRRQPDHRRQRRARRCGRASRQQRRRASSACAGWPSGSPPKPRVSATVLQTVGSKGHDGLLVALVIAPPPEPAEPE